MSVALYVRVSTSEQVEGYSIDEQITRLRNYCAAHDWPVGKVYTDAGYSGGNTDRPALQELIRDIKSLDKVIVYKLDRLSRSQKDTLELIEDVFLANGCDFISMTENFDTSTPFGKAMIGILAVFAQLEREQIKERMSMGREGRAREGKFRSGGKVPIGYDYDNGDLTVNEYEAMQVRELFDSYLSGTSIREIERIFGEKGYTHKHGKWQFTTISYVLQNDLYIGNVHYKGNIYKGHHEPLISEEVFEACNAIKKRRSKHSPTSWSRSTILGGLVYCAQCGAKFGVKKQKDRRYYCCYTRRKQSRVMMRGEDCHNKTWRMEELDDLILGEIKKLAFDPDYVFTIQPPSETNKAEIIQKQISNIDEQRKRLIDLYALGEFSIEEIQGKIAELNERKEKLKAELTVPDMSVNEVREIVKDFAGVIERGDFNEISQLVRALIDRIEIDNEDVTIRWAFS
ncbi:MAG: recombinase family protein [Bacteroidales bacterium]|nr:recombinase family protein [Bacteroidales bacterium]